MEVSWHDTGYRQEVCEGSRGARGVHENLKKPAWISSGSLRGSRGARKVRENLKKPAWLSSGFPPAAGARLFSREFL